MVHVQVMHAREAQYAEPRTPLAHTTRAALAARGIERLFVHQVAAVDVLCSSGNPPAGQQSRAHDSSPQRVIPRHVVVATSTASGKSLCYVVPLLEALTRNSQVGLHNSACLHACLKMLSGHYQYLLFRSSIRHHTTPPLTAPHHTRQACALLMFPTKALAQDQLRALRCMLADAFGADAPGVEVRGRIDGTAWVLRRRSCRLFVPVHDKPPTDTDCNQWPSFLCDLCIRPTACCRSFCVLQPE